ncbi:hypothetical protein FACS18948_5020 [Clostridia bacterium]|nr:hypothetical protein FACS18948_5020 [Clostridia bacterium]
MIDSATQPMAGTYALPGGQVVSSATQPTPGTSREPCGQAEPLGAPGPYTQPTRSA